MIVGSGLTVAAKNAVATLAAAVPLGAAVSYLPTGMSGDALVWGALGGLTRAVALRKGWGDAASGVVVGAITAAGTNGAKLPFISDYVSADSPQIQQFAVGVIAVIIIMLGPDVVRGYMKRIGGGK